MTLETWLSEHHRAAYEFQLERIDKLRDRVSFLTGLLTILGGGILYLAINYPHAWRGLGCLLFYVPAILALALFLVSAALVLYCIAWSFKYMFVPSAQEIQNYADQITKYAGAVPAKKVDPLAKVQQHLSQRQCQAATHNWEVNRSRASKLLVATQLLVLSFLLLLVALPWFFVDSGSKQPSVTKVIITEPIKVNK